MASHWLRCWARGAHFFVQVCGHLVQHFGQRAEFQRIGHGEAVGEVAAGEPLRALLELLQGPGDAARQHQGDARQHQRRQQAPGEQMKTDARQGPLDGRQGDRRPHDADDLAIAAQRDSHVAQGLSDGLALAQGNAGAAGQGVLYLGAVGMVVHPLGRFLAVAHHLAVGQDDGEPRVGFFSQLLAQGVDLRISPGGQQGAKLLLGQQGPRLKLRSRAVEIELPQRGYGIQGDGRQANQRDEQIRRIKLPEQASFAHGSILPRGVRYP